MTFIFLSQLVRYTHQPPWCMSSDLSLFMRYFLFQIQLCTFIIITQYLDICSSLRVFSNDVR